MKNLILVIAASALISLNVSAQTSKNVPVNVKTAFSHGNADSIAKTEDIPIVTAIGIPINSNIGNTANKVNPVCNANSIKFPPLKYKPLFPNLLLHYF